MSSDFNSKCRTCLSASSIYHQLFDYIEDENCKIIEMLDILVPQINIRNTTQFSTLVCTVCVTNLRSGYKFQQMCLETNKRLKEMSENTVEEEIESDNEWFPDKVIQIDNGKSVCLAQKKKSIDCLELSTSIAVNEVVDLTPQIHNAISDGHLQNQLLTRQEPEITESIAVIDGGLSVVGNKQLEFGLKEIPDLQNILQVKTTDGLATNSKIIVKEDIDVQAEASAQNSVKDIDNYLFATYVATMTDTVDVIDQKVIHGVESNDCLSVANYLKCEHVKNLHPKLEKHKCSICSKMFLSQVSLSSHINKRHKNFGKRANGHTVKKGMRIQEPLMCTQCGKTFFSKRSLCAHRKIHKSAQKGVLGDLIKHDHKMNAATSGSIKDNKYKKSYYNFPCEVCGKVFNRPAMLKRHSAVHSPTRPYQCLMCTYRFADEKALRIHMQQHANTAENVRLE